MLSLFQRKKKIEYALPIAGWAGIDKEKPNYNYGPNLKSERISRPDNINSFFFPNKPQIAVVKIPVIGTSLSSFRSRMAVTTYRYPG